MTEERREEIKSCLNSILSEQPQKIQEQEDGIAFGLFFQSYFSLVFGEDAGQEFTFQSLFDRVEKGRFQWEFYMEWQKSFSHFLYLMTGRQEAAGLFDYMELGEKEEEKRPAERYVRKAVRRLKLLDLFKEEAEEYLKICLDLYFDRVEKRGGCPKALLEGIGTILFYESKNKKGPIVIYGADAGWLPVWLKENSREICLEADEADVKKDSLARLLYFALDWDKEWVKEPGKSEIELGVSLRPFGKTKEKDEGDFFPDPCIPSQRGGLRCLGKWLSRLSARGTFYFLCPAGILYRKGREKNLRQFLVEEKNLLDGIFLLPYDLRKSGLPQMVILKFQRGRQENETIYLLDASGEKAEKIKGFAELFLQREEKKGLSVHLTKQLIKDQEMNLNPARYLNKKEITGEEKDSIEEAKAKLSQIEERLAEIERQKKIYELELNFLQV